MRLEKRKLGALWFFILTPFPLLPMSIWWSVETQESLAMRILVNCIVGAFIGSVVVVGAAESLRSLIVGAEAQQLSTDPHDAKGTGAPVSEPPAPVVGTEITGNGAGGTGADISVTGSAGTAPRIGLDTSVTAAPGQSAIGLRVIQTGPARRGW